MTDVDKHCIDDTARYQWIRRNWGIAHGVIFLEGLFTLARYETLDDAIDAAILNERKNDERTN